MRRRIRRFCKPIYTENMCKTATPDIIRLYFFIFIITLIVIYQYHTY